MRFAGVAAFAVYAGCVPAANVLVERVGLVEVGYGMLAPAGVFVAGLAFSARDGIQRYLGRGYAVLAILTGALLSLALASPALAFASAAAFLSSEVLDMAVWSPLEAHSPRVALLLSNTVGAIMDSSVFLWLAYGSLQYFTGQTYGKLIMTFPVLAVLVLAQSRHKQSAA